MLGFAGHGGIRSIMDDMTLLSTEAEGVNDTIPDDFKPSHVNAAGRVGALLGLTDDGSPSGKPKPAHRAMPVTADAVDRICPPLPKPILLPPIGARPPPTPALRKHET